MFQWDEENQNFLPAGSIVSRAPILEDVAISSLRQYYVLTALRQENDDKDKLSPTFAILSSSNFTSPAHHPQHRQESFYITPQCLFPLDRTCDQPAIDFEIEWAGLASASSSLLVSSLLLLYLARLSWEEVGADVTRKLRNLLPLYEWLDSHTRLLVNIASVLIGMLSCHEILFQPSFVNDWPAHLHHVEQFLQGRLDFSSYMHFHGHNAYPAAFLYLYTSLYYMSGGSLRVFQLVWAIMEVASLRSIAELGLQLRLGPAACLLPFASNRLHLYHVRVVTNDGINVALMLSAVRLLTSGHQMLGTMLYSLVLGMKLNFILFLPAWCWATLRSVDGEELLGRKGMAAVARGLLLLLLLQGLLGFPFLAGNFEAYLEGAYDLSRTLLWDKTRVFKWVGRSCFLERRFHLLLLLVSGSLAARFLLLCDRACLQRPNARARKRILIRGVLTFNQGMVCFARALYTPFLSWYFYSLPTVMALSKMSQGAQVVCWISHELLFRSFDSPLTDAWASWILFVCNTFIAFRCCLKDEDEDEDEDEDGDNDEIRRQGRRKSRVLIGDDERSW